MHLAYELLEGYDAVVLVDAVPRGDEPGTLFVIEPDIDGLAPAVPGAPVMDAHSLTPDAVFALLKTLGGRLDRALVVGCEPADTDERMGLSEPVAAAVAPAVRLVRELLIELTETSQGAGPAFRGEKDTGTSTPPYDDIRQQEMKPGHEEHMAKIFSGEGGEPGPGREVSEEERKGVSDTDTTGASPLDVGESISDRGEERILGDAGPESRRADEYSEERRRDREGAGISNAEPISEEMPRMKPGDQAG